jgi:Zn-finger nucleic acid-binding protein
MAILELSGVEIDFCPRCRGIWVDRGELGLLLHGRPDAPSSWLRSDARPGRRPCPHCDRTMLAGTSPGTHVTVDACPHGHGIWLDRDELEELIKTRDSPEEVAALARYCQSVFSKTGDPS